MNHRVAVWHPPGVTAPPRSWGELGSRAADRKAGPPLLVRLCSAIGRRSSQYPTRLEERTNRRPRYSSWLEKWRLGPLSVATERGGREADGCASASGLTSYWRSARSRRGLASGTGGSSRSEGASCPICEVNRLPRVRPHITVRLNGRRRAAGDCYALLRTNHPGILAGKPEDTSENQPIGVGLIAKALRDVFSRSFCQHLRASLNLRTSHIIPKMK